MGSTLPMSIDKTLTNPCAEIPLVEIIRNREKLQEMFCTEPKYFETFVVVGERVVSCLSPKDERLYTGRSYQHVGWDSYNNAFVFWKVPDYSHYSYYGNTSRRFL